MNKVRLPDPHGMIARVRARLNPEGVVRRSPYCDVIISMRMQGLPWREIEGWLISQGQQHRISAPTLWRNFKKAKIEVSLTYAEEMIEKLGGRIDLDLIREMSQNIVTQKERIDGLVRAEQETRKKSGRENFSDKRIANEMKLQAEMVAALHRMLERAPETLRDAQADIRRMQEQGVKVTPEAASVLTDMIINDEITVSPYDLPVPGHTRH